MKALAPTARVPLSKRAQNSHNSSRNFAKPTKLWVAALAIAMGAGLASTPPAHADAVQAKALFKAMSDYLAAQKSISFDVDTNLEIVTKEIQKIALASSGTVTLTRPDKLHATRTGGFADTEMVFDGKTLTSSSKYAKEYAQADAPGTIDQLIGVLRDEHHRPVPAADLLMADAYAHLMPEVVDVKDLGSGVIHGTECDHVALRTKEVDLQIWIAQGGRPYPCRYVITSTKVVGWPQYTVEVRNWKTGSDVAADAFSFKAPADFKKVNPDQLQGADELPAIFAPK
jgi:hypothetical protein